ncbi:Aluminum-activated malate transporter 10 [Hibiscus syriacus]|uniref:Aluminum-activated malate transporter 10 n=2 Tax=Hibiscus syriacus TaxID=106335 RepID=A0A6A2YPR8_HIBSY|nr:Aluminum-activated malate transporter 10 [Hibiscus syriacus]
MVPEKDGFEGVEWRIRVADGSSEVPVTDTSLARKVWLRTKDLFSCLGLKVWMFLKKAWDIGANDPRKVIHCFKVGLALTLVSLFYFMRPLYDGVGGNAMWALMTVVLVFEPNVGATLYKCLNRIFATFFAGFLAFGVHWIASRSGDRFEPYIVGASVFLFASMATFFRFIPSVKSLFDYGAMVFILTFSFVAVSGYRVDKLFDFAHQRISTIIIGTSLCILVIILVCPIWCGQELHGLTVRNMDKLADSLSGCVTHYFTNINGEDDKRLQAYKCVLSSKASEDSMANFARWEPSHGRFNFRHPWKQYLKIGASMRSCAYCIEALNSCINKENKAAESIKKHLSASCLEVSSSSSSAIRELSESLKKMKLPTVHMFIGEMNRAVEELKNDLKSLSQLLDPSTTGENKEYETPFLEATGSVLFMEIIPVVTLASILIEIAVRTEALVGSVEDLAKLANFATIDDKFKKCDMKDKIVPDEEKPDGTLEALQRV